METDWEVFKQKKTELLEEKLKAFISRLEKIRSNRIVLEVIEREINLKLTEGKNPTKPAASLSISPNHELVVSNFEPKKTSLITNIVLQLGYNKLEEKSSKEKLYFVLSIMTKEKRDKCIQESKKIAEEGKKSFGLVHQDLKRWLKKEKSLSQDQKKSCEKQSDKLEKDYREKLMTAREKKEKELSS